MSGLARSPVRPWSPRGAYLALSCILALSLAHQLSARPQTATSSTSIARLRSSAKVRRPQLELCRENLPRKSEDLPALVASARVKEVYFQNGANDTSPPADNKALLTVKRVFKGNQQLVGSDIVVSGFNQTSSVACPNYVKANDTYILLLNQDAERKYSIHNGNLFSLNLNNLDRVNAVASDEAYRRRQPIDDILCEAHYCPFGRCLVKDDDQPTCDCPSSCPPLPQPVCGSDNQTYTSECHLIKEGCKRQRPLFVTKEVAC